MKQYKILLALLALPQLAFAQASLQTFIPNLVKFVSNVLIPFLFAIAFFIFVFAAFKYFVLESANEEGREKAKNLALYTILAFLFLIIFWGLINVIANSVGLQGTDQPCPDYIMTIDPTKCP
ncbi:MAG: hypothetical protein R3B60_00265 [Candidatus Paceibacterota bacterium]